MHVYNSGFPHFFMQPKFWTEPADAVKSAYSITDSTILDKSGELGRGGSTAVTAILINCQKLVVANIGDSRAVLCQNGQAKQLSVDHEPSVESEDIKNRGGFVSNFPGTNHILKCCMVFYLHLDLVLHNIIPLSEVLVLLVSMLLRFDVYIFSKYKIIKLLAFSFFVSNRSLSVLRKSILSFMLFFYL